MSRNIWLLGDGFFPYPSNNQRLRFKAEQNKRKIEIKNITELLKSVHNIQPMLSPIPDSNELGAITNLLGIFHYNPPLLTPFDD